MKTKANPFRSRLIAVFPAVPGDVSIKSTLCYQASDNYAEIMTMPVDVNNTTYYDYGYKIITGDNCHQHRPGAFTEGAFLSAIDAELYALSELRARAVNLQWLAGDGLRIIEGMIYARLQASLF